MAPPPSRIAYRVRDAKRANLAPVFQRVQHRSNTSDARFTADRLLRYGRRQQGANSRPRSVLPVSPARAARSRGNVWLAGETSRACRALDGLQVSAFFDAFVGATSGQHNPPRSTETRRQQRPLKAPFLQLHRDRPKSQQPALNPKVEGSNPSRPMREVPARVRSGRASPSLGGSNREGATDGATRALFRRRRFSVRRSSFCEAGYRDDRRDGGCAAACSVVSGRCSDNVVWAYGPRHGCRAGFSV